MKDELEAWLTDEVGTAVTISRIERTSYGYSRENWVVDASWDATACSLIARRDPPGSVLETDRGVEVAVLQAITRTEVPSPIVRWVDLVGDRTGRPCVVMDRVDGACEPFCLNDPARSADARLSLAHRIYDELSRIHSLDVSSLDLGDVLVDPGHRAADAALDHWLGVLRGVQREPEPELALVCRWLRQHAPQNRVTTLVHGDFKPGNVLLTADDRVAAVLDWETAHLGDPHEDLGWVTNPLRAGEHRIAGAWESADLLERWSAATGFDVDTAAVRWWQVLANVKLAAIVLTGVAAFHDGRLDRLTPCPVGIYRLLLDQIGA